jgi:hypothetical protein
MVCRTTKAYQERLNANRPSTSRANNTSSLPDDVMRKIGARLSPTMLIRLAAVNRQRRAALAENVARVGPDARIHALAKRVYAIKDDHDLLKRRVGMMMSVPQYRMKYVISRTLPKWPFRWEMSTWFYDLEGFDKSLPPFDAEDLALARRVMDDPRAWPRDRGYNRSRVLAYILVLGVLRGLPLRVSQRKGDALDRGGA